MIAYMYSVNPEANVMHQWDSGFLLDVLSGKTWKPPLWTDFAIKEVSRIPKKHKRALVAIPARHNAEHIDVINQDLKKIERLVLFLMGDEEADFPVEMIDHPNCVIYVQNPHPVRHDNYFKIGTGYPPQINNHIPESLPDKNVPVFFSGQITHKRRIEMIDNLREFERQGNKCDVNVTKGFTQGFWHKEYYERMSHGKIAPAPSGAVIPDSFRAYEAMEMMCVLIADNRNSSNTVSNYWNWIFNEQVPFYTIDAYDNLVGYCYEILDDWNRLVQKQTAWYIKYKRDFVYKLMENLYGEPKPEA